MSGPLKPDFGFVGMFGSSQFLSSQTGTDQPTMWSRMSFTNHPAGVTPGRFICRGYSRAPYNRPASLFVPTISFLFRSFATNRLRISAGGSDAYGSVADFRRWPFSSGKSTSFCASLTLSMNEPPPCMFSILTMSDKSAYCTDACESLLFSRISGEL